jgi:hypothetical protein
LLATDYFTKARQAEKDGDRLAAINFYFQAFRSIEKYLGEAIHATIDGKELLLVNEIYASIQSLLDKIKVQVTPTEILLNRRLNLNSQTVMASAVYTDSNIPAANLPLAAAFEKGAGDVFPTYKMDEQGKAKVLINKIGSRELEQTVVAKVDIDALSGTASSPIYGLIAKTLNVPRGQVILKVQRPIVYMTSNEKSLGYDKSNYQISNRLKNLLANSGFEFSDDKQTADLWVDVKADSEKGAVSGSIYITYLTSVIKVTAVKEGKEVYSTTLDRVKGYGLDYDKSSVDAYSKALETLEKERMSELLNTVLQ